MAAACSEAVLGGGVCSAWAPLPPQHPVSCHKPPVPLQPRAFCPSCLPLHPARRSSPSFPRHLTLLQDLIGVSPAFRVSRHWPNLLQPHVPLTPADSTVLTGGGAHSFQTLNLIPSPLTLRPWWLCVTSVLLSPWSSFRRKIVFAVTFSGAHVLRAYCPC